MERPRLSRRRFVKTAGLGAGVLAAAPAQRIFAADSIPMAEVIKKVWQPSKEYLMEFANAMPEGKYEFKPTDEVFSFAEQLLHLAGANYWFFSTIKGEKPPLPEEALKPEGKSRDDVIKLVEESLAFGGDVIEGLTDESAAAEVSMGQRKLAAWKLIMFCVDHISHHRGQMVVYLRLNGIKPPQYRSGFIG